jgi:NIPSNAP
LPKSHSMTEGSTKLPDLAPNLDDDPFCELRIYRVAAGRLHDMESRVRNDLRTLFPKHGIRPLAGWLTTVSPVSPAYVYVTPWRNMNERSAAWAGFYGDPEWAEVRTRTNAGNELVESYEIMFLRAVTPWSDAPALPAFSELIIQSTAVGKSSAVVAELNEAVLPILTGEGAHIMGVFDMMSGRPLPALVFLLGWDSLDQRSAAMTKLDHRTSAARAAGSPVLLDRAEQHLLRGVPVDWA